jgi:hypothetical protein
MILSKIKIFLKIAFFSVNMKCNKKVKNQMRGHLLGNNAAFDIEKAEFCKNFVVGKLC